MVVVERARGRRSGFVVGFPQSSSVQRAAYFGLVQALNAVGGR